jgi:choline dehydrogenase-like flavoprotein
MFVDARTIPNNDILTTDICIIGAGAAGITLARAFSGRPFRVSMLESGDITPDNATQSLYVGEDIGLRYFPLETSRLRLFGGTTNHWGGHCRPFDEIDFEARDWIPHSGWPIRKSDVAPYYARAQSIVGVHVADWDITNWTKQDRFPPLPLIGDRMNTRIAEVVPGEERSFGQRYRKEIEQANNVITYLNANVAEIETNPTGTAVTGVRVACLSGTTFSLTAKLVILAAGGIENARLLLLSNTRQPAGLGNQHDLVGRFFMDHPRFEAGRIMPADKNLEVRFYEPHAVNKASIKGYLGLSEELVRRERLVDVQVSLEAVYTASYTASLQSNEVVSLKYLLQSLRRRQMPDDFGMHLANVMSDLTTTSAYIVPTAPFPELKPEVYSKIMQANAVEREQLIAEFFGNIAYVANEETFGRTPLEDIQVLPRIDPTPNPDSRITLGDQRDQLGQRKVKLDWRLSPLDKHSVRRTLEIFGAELGRAGLGRLQIGIGDDDTTWPADTRGGWHHMGTTRMSEHPSQGVVDKNCQVHGIANLFIAGSSVFPTAGSGTPTLMLVCLALRLADKIQEIMR